MLAVQPIYVFSCKKLLYEQCTVEEIDSNVDNNHEK